MPGTLCLRVLGNRNPTHLHSTACGPPFLCSANQTGANGKLDFVTLVLHVDRICSIAASLGSILLKRCCGDIVGLSGESWLAHTYVAVVRAVFFLLPVFAQTDLSSGFGAGTGAIAPCCTGTG